MGSRGDDLADSIRVLIVDDEPSEVEMAKLSLEDADTSLKIDTVNRPRDALEILRHQPYECIVSDYQMPEMNGIQLCAEIRRFSSIPFIIYTGRGSEEVAADAFTAGADDYFRKENELSHYRVLARRIRQLVERRRFEDLYRMSIEENRDGFALIQGTDFLYANQAMANMLGLKSPSDLIGHSILHWVVEMQRDLIKNRALSRQRGEEQPRVYEYRIRRADGEIRTLEASVSLINYLGKPVSLVFNHDVTERRAAEEELKKSLMSLRESEEELQSLNEELSASNEELHSSEEELRIANDALSNTNDELIESRNAILEYSSTLEDHVNKRTVDLRRSEERLKESANYTRNLIEASLDPLVTISPGGKITDVNEATVQVTGVPRENLVGSDFSSYFTEPEKAREVYEKVFREGSVRDYPLAIRHTSGRVTDVLYHATLYRNSRGQVQGVFAAARDITNRKRAEERIREAERTEAVSKLTSMLAHDLRNPLSFIVQASELAKKQPDKAGRMLQLIRDNAERSLAMIEDLRTVTREVSLKREETDISKLLRNVAEQVRVTNKVNVKIDVPDRLELSVDPSLMRRVIENLVSNAVDAMPKGGTLTLRSKVEDHRTLIEVEDTGTGIPEEVIPHMFVHFYSTKPKGMGLGLTFVKRIVEAHGGTLTFTTKAGVGTTFTISLSQEQ